MTGKQHTIVYVVRLS